MKDRTEFGSSILPVVNYLAWPIHLQDDESVKWRNKFSYVMDTQCLGLAEDIGFPVREDVFLPPTTTSNWFVWAKCLTKMRNEMIETCQARICVGGRNSQYKGMMPGVLEEILISNQIKVPLFLCGGFGGMVGQVCELIQGGRAAEITEKWQVENNPGYATLLDLMKEHGLTVDYESIRKDIAAVKIGELAKRCGLTADEYEHLMKSDYVEECVRLINKGLLKIAKKINEVYKMLDRLSL